MKNYYRVLSVAATATVAELKAAYRKAALATHPDQTGAADGSLFAQVNEAYQVLSDPVRRTEYEEVYIECAGRLGYVVCEVCFTQNRLPRFGAKKIPKCGGCRAKLAVTPQERDSRIRDAVAEQAVELVETLGTEGASLAKDAVKSAANWTRRKLGITRS